jgi:hypothetical protein
MQRVDHLFKGSFKLQALVKPSQARQAALELNGDEPALAR